MNRGLSVKIEWESVAEGKVLHDPVSVGFVHHGGFAETATALGTLGLQQVAAACVRPQNLSGARYLEAFGYSLSCLNAFGATHNRIFLCFRKKSAQYRSRAGAEQEVISP